MKYARYRALCLVKCLWGIWANRYVYMRLKSDLVCSTNDNSQQRREKTYNDLWTKWKEESGLQFSLPEMYLAELLPSLQKGRTTLHNVDRGLWTTTCSFSPSSSRLVASGQEKEISGLVLNPQPTATRANMFSNRSIAEANEFCCEAQHCWNNLYKYSGTCCGWIKLKKILQKCNEQESRRISTRKKKTETQHQAGSQRNGFRF